MNPTNEMPHEEFYTQLVDRARPFVGSEAQIALRKSHILVAGLGSVGGPIAKALVRGGAEIITIADPDIVEYSNLARQPYFYRQIGINKAHALGRNIIDVNPFVNITVVPEGITTNNVTSLVRGADIVVDAIDLQALDIVYDLHQNASTLNKPTFVGYDLGSTAILRYYPYHQGPPMGALNGEITTTEVDQFRRIRELCYDGIIEKGVFINLLYSLMPRLIDLQDVPTEQLEEALNRETDDTTIYQDSPTPLALSALAVTAIRNSLSEQKVSPTMRIDLQTAVKGGETVDEKNERTRLAEELKNLLQDAYLSIVNNYL